MNRLCKETVTKRSMLESNCFKDIFQHFWPQIMVQNVCLAEKPFLSKTSAGPLWNFSLFELCMHLIFNCTCKESYYEIFLNWKPSHTNILKKTSWKYWMNLQENTNTEIWLRVVIRPIGLQASDVKTKYKSRIFDAIWMSYGCHMGVIWISFACTIHGLFQVRSKNIEKSYRI